MYGGQRGGSGEWRIAYIVYFLSCNGTLEDPHLIKVRQFLSNGVHLRDVKRWLTEHRGSDVADSFAWSYKRRYRGGYYWEDLKDDDLITPISDTEYILKGSLLQNGFSSDKNTKKDAVSEHQVVPEPKSEPPPETLRVEQEEDGGDDVSPKPPQTELDGDSPIKPGSTNRRMAGVRTDPSAKKKEGDHKGFKRSYSSRVSQVFRNILKCGANDAALMPVSGSSGHRQGKHHQKSSETDNNSRKSRRSASKSGGSAVSYKPMGAPNCSQCGRPFDPEKLHSHMQSCRALRGGREKGKISTDRVPLRRGSRSEGDFSRESISGYLT